MMRVEAITMEKDRVDLCFRRLTSEEAQALVKDLEAMRQAPSEAVASTESTPAESIDAGTKSSS